jgi:ABC-type transport system involved in multi-copper enzyme maturation permease subunit
MSWLRETAGMIRAEWIKLWRRGFAMAGLVVAVIHGLLVFVVMFGIHGIQRWGAKAQGGLPADLFDGVQGGEWTLFAMYLPVMGVVLLAVVGELFAGEYAQRTYSLLLIRPVARWRVFLAKFAASYLYVLVVLAAAMLVASVLGLAAFGMSRQMVMQGMDLPVGLGTEQSFGLRLVELGVKYVAVSISMLPILAVTAFLAVVTRSTALTVTYTIILLIIDGGIWLTFPYVTQALEYEIFGQIKPFTILANRNFMVPYFFGAGEMTIGEFITDSGKQLAMIAAYTAAFVGGAIAVFTMQDVE